MNPHEHMVITIPSPVYLPSIYLSIYNNETKKSWNDWNEIDSAFGILRLTDDLVCQSLQRVNWTIHRRRFLEQLQDVQVSWMPKQERKVFVFLFHTRIANKTQSDIDCNKA